jgi:peroxin-10
MRALLVLLPTLPSYLLTRWGGQLSDQWPAVKSLPIVLEVVAEINLAVFYMRGTYYDAVKRLLGVRHVS